MGSAAGGLLVLLIFFAVFAVAEYFDRRPKPGPSLVRISLTSDSTAPSQAVAQYVLGSIGTLRVDSLWNAATAKVGDASWRFKASGGSVLVTSTDAAGRPVGEYHDRTHSLRWGSRELDLLRGFGRRSSAHRKRPVICRDARYVLAEYGPVVAFLRADGRDWRTNPINIELDQTAEAVPALLLFAAFVGAWLAHRDRTNDGL